MSTALRRVLVVDDDDLERAVFCRHLRAAGWYIDEAASAAEAMGLAGRQAYDTIVLDYWLPDQSGPAIIRSIRAAAKDANLVVVTGDPAPEREREAMAGGADGFWRKSTGSFDEFFRGLYQRRGHAPS